MSADRPAAEDASCTDAPLLDEVMPWSVAPLRPGRDWVRAPHAAWLKARWQALTAAEDEADRSALFAASRSRTLHSTVAPLPGRPGHTAPLAQEQGRCPEPVRVLHGAFDEQWLIPDHRLLDGARPELWRVTGAGQTHLVETAHDTRHPGPLVSFTALLPDGHSPAGRPGRIRPLHRRPGGEPNVLPGLLEHLGARLGVPVQAADLLAWVAATVRAGPRGRIVPLTADAALWQRGVSVGRLVLWLHTRGARYGPGPDGAARPRLPGGRRPYVRAPLPAAAAPDALVYDADEGALHVGPGRIAPVEPAAWEFEVAGERVLEAWFAERAGPAAPGTLAGVRPPGSPQEWTPQLLELITVLTMLAELRAQQRRLARELAGAEQPGQDGVAGGSEELVGRTELRRAGLLPPPASARRPASVLDVPEEGPGGQLALL